MGVGVEGQEVESRLNPETLRALDRWVDRGLISPEQRMAIIDHEGRVVDRGPESGVGRLANAVSTVGAAIAIAAVVGIVALFASDWSTAQTMVAAAIGSIVMILSAWGLVRGGWGAPAGLCAFCGLALIPLTIGLGVDVAGWWPEDIPERPWEETQELERRTAGLVLLASIVPGMATVRLGLRQAWTALPAALWFGALLLVANPFDNPALTMAQAVVGAAVAGVAAFVLGMSDRERDTRWWLQLGGLLLFAQAIAFSGFEDHAGYWLLAIVAAAVVFIVGVVRDRTSWIVASAVPVVIPIFSLIFEYFEGLAGLLILAILGLGAAFLPVLLRRRGERRADD